MNNPDNNIRNKVNAIEKRKSLLGQLEKNKKIVDEYKLNKTNKKSDTEDTTEQTIKVTM